MLLEDFEKITRSLADCFLLIDTEGTILSGNNAAFKTLKTNSKSLCGKNLYDLAPEQPDKVKRYIGNWARSAEPLPGVLKIQTGDENVLDFHIRGNLLQQKTTDHPARILLRSQSKQVLTGGFTSLNNKIKQLENEIVERKQAEDSFKRYEQIANSISDYMAFISPDYRYLAVNNQFLEAFNLTREKVLNNPVKDIVGEENFKVLTKPSVDKALAGKEVKIQVWTKLSDSERRYMDVNYIPYRSAGGKITGVIILSHDITDYKEAEDEIRKLNEDLEQRVEERTAELVKANADLQQSLELLEHAQDQLVQSEKMASLGGLVAGVAHEINTPIGVCVTTSSHLADSTNNYTRLYKENTLTRNDFEGFLNNVSECSDIIQSNLNRAADLIKSFKKVAVDQSSDEVREFILKEYLQEILQSLSHELKSHAHEIKLECPDNMRLCTHPGAVSQIVTNLIMNSIRHGFEGIKHGIIRITVYKDDDAIKISYSDNGVGLTQEASSKIFEPFYTTKRNQGGSGLGMHIVYNLITQTLGGNIVCQSVLNEGINFIIQFPVREVGAKTEQEHQEIRVG